MTKHRAVVTGWDPAKVNPDGSTGRPKGVQTAIDHRIMSTYDVLAEGIFAKAGVPAITGSPTNSASISAFQAAIASPLGGFYIVSIDAPENFTINLANVGAVKIYVQQQDYEVDSSKVNSEVVIGVVYGATPIPAGSLLLFTTTITAQTSTNGLTFTPAFKYTGAASGQIRVPTQADLANVAVLQQGIRALVTGGAQAGEYFYDGSAWQLTTVTNPSLAGMISTGWVLANETWTFVSYNSTTQVGIIGVPSNATTKYAEGQFVRFAQATGGTKYGRILSVSATQLTVWLPSFTLNNEAITAPNYSFVARPYGLPITIADGNPYKASVYRNGGYALSSGVATKVFHDFKDYDNLNSWSGVDFRYVAQVSGYYDIVSQVQIGSAGMGTTESSLGYLFKNGSEIRRSNQMIGSGNANQINRHQISDQVYLNAGDFIEHYGQCFGGRDITGGRNNTYLTIKLASRG